MQTSPFIMESHPRPLANTNPSQRRHIPHGSSRSMATTLVATLALVAMTSLVATVSAVHNPEDTVLFIRTQSLYPPYIDHEMSNRWFDFGGDTIINTNRYVRLTPEMQGRKGWLRSKTALYAESWSVEFEYKIHGKATHLAGDGMAFWYTEDKIDKVGTVLGGPETWKGLSIVFDTYDNGRHGYSYPYVAALYNDGTKTYNKDTDGKELELGGCQADIRNKDYATRARIRFVKGKYLKVELNTKGWDDWTTCFQVSDVKLFDMGFMSFTGETGGLADNHDIISVSTNQILKDDSKLTHTNPDQKDHFNSSFMKGGESKGPSYFFIVMVIGLLAAIVFFGGRAMGISAFGGQSQRDFKHF
ncbi:legume-like lectin family-domain-containing protein [Catenaria anguillulae PL171]|uniref:Legume-like lectin family-domain-containing protein n=1 Tax=Catenaria anguillulae PL171 TaxID=765915 RepID=A0A1Y2I259_9FUNG|nr:legume-like lectin family-domain-containing protein [Catenaria anguillulae PL171]